jgi:hypothetical protein
VSVEASVKKGDGKPGDRFGKRQLTLTKDPYAVAVEDLAGAELVLISDEGARLPSA